MKHVEIDEHDKIDQRKNDHRLKQYITDYVQREKEKEELKKKEHQSITSVALRFIKLIDDGAGMDEDDDDPLHIDKSRKESEEEIINERARNLSMSEDYDDDIIGDDIAASVAASTQYFSQQEGYGSVLTPQDPSMTNIEQYFVWLNATIQRDLFKLLLKEVSIIQILFNQITLL